MRGFIYSLTDRIIRTIQSLDRETKKEQNKGRNFYF